MERYEHHEIVIVGGGICGLATALAFHRKGIKSLVLERWETLRAAGAAISMMANGWRALDHLGVGDELRQSAIRLNGAYRIPVPDNGKRIRFAVGDGEEARCIKRNDLVKTLANHLPSETVRFGSRVVSVKTEDKSSRTIIRLDDGNVLSAKLVIGCDGVHSIVSEALGLNPMKVTSTSAIRGFTYYPDGHNLPREIRIYAPEKGLFGCMPITNNSVYWFVIGVKRSQDSQMTGDKLRIQEDALEFIKGYDQKLINIVKNTDVDMLVLTTNIILRSPFDLLTSTFRKGTVTVAGDALHAMGPFLGQGGSLCLEDAVILARCVAPCISTGPSGPMVGKNIEQALDQYFQLRKMRAFWIMCQTYLIGILAGTHSSKLLKLLSIFLLMVLDRDSSYRNRFDCGPL